MSNKRKGSQQVAVADNGREGELLTGQGGAKAEAFSFGDPVPVLDGREVLDHLECWANGRWYEPPVSLDGLARSTKASVYLQSGLNFRRNMLVRTFKPHRLLSRQAFEQFATDFGWCGNAYLEKKDNMLGQAIRFDEFRLPGTTDS